MCNQHLVVQETQHARNNAVKMLSVNDKSMMLPSSKVFLGLLWNIGTASMGSSQELLVPRVSSGKGPKVQRFKSSID